MRTFLAIELDEFIRNNLNNYQHTIKNTKSADIKYVESKNIHLTLKFFGEIDEEKLEEIDQIITKTVPEYEEYILKVATIGTFPKNSSNPRVIWTGIKDKTRTTIALIKELDEEFSKIGFKKERDYQPHITIGRVKQVTHKERLQQVLKKFKNDYYGKMTVKSIKLKKSTLTADGPLYETIKEYPLKQVNP